MSSQPALSRRKQKSIDNYIANLDLVNIMEQTNTHCIHLTYYGQRDEEIIPP
jgi:hypothetical protein